MKAFYDPKQNCNICMDMENWRPVEFSCSDCKKLNREDVEVLKFGVGLFDNKAVIKRHSGQLSTVSIETITIID